MIQLEKVLVNSFLTAAGYPPRNVKAKINNIYYIWIGNWVFEIGFPIVIFEFSCNLDEVTFAVASVGP